MPQRTRQEAGYTLLEMMTVVAISALVAGLAVASVGSLRERTAVRQGAEQVQQLLQSARRRAMASARCYRVDLLDGSGRPVEAGAPASAVRLRRFLRAGCERSPASPPPAEADFDQEERFGLPQGVTARLTGTPEAIVILPSGRPRLGDGETRVRLQVSYLGEDLRVDLTAPGAACVQPSSAEEACP